MGVNELSRAEQLDAAIAARREFLGKGTNTVDPSSRPATDIYSIVAANPQWPISKVSSVVTGKPQR